MADRHRKLDKEDTKKTADRLKYLLGQSEKIGRLKAGKERADTNSDARKEKDNEYHSKHSRDKNYSLLIIVLSQTDI